MSFWATASGTAVISASAALLGVTLTLWFQNHRSKQQQRLDVIQRSHELRLKACYTFLIASRLLEAKTMLGLREADEAVNDECNQHYRDLLEQLEVITLVSSSSLAAQGEGVQGALFKLSLAHQRDSLEEERKQQADYREARAAFVEIARSELGGAQLDKRNLV